MIADQTEKGKLSLTLAVILGINTVVGAGIFAMPLTLVKMAGAAGLMTVFFAALCVLFLGLAFARLSSLFPQGGGFYAYTSAWAGRSMGAIVAGIYLIGLTIALGAVLLPAVSNIIGIYMTGVSSNYIGYFIIAGTIIATFFASSLAAVGQTILFICTLVPIFFIGYLCLKQGSLTRFYPFLTHGWQGVFRAMPTVLFTFLGFESITSLSRVIKNPVRTIPLATIYTIICVSLLYLAFVGSVIAGMPGDLLASKNSLSEVLLYAMSSYTWIVHCINFAMIITILGTVYSVTWALSELLLQCVKKLTNEKFNFSETSSLLIIGSGMLVSMKLLASNEKAFNVVALCVVLAYSLSIMYLLIKPARLSDWLVGSVALLSSLLFFISAFSQLI